MGDSGQSLDKKVAVFLTVCYPFGKGLVYFYIFRLKRVEIAEIGEAAAEMIDTDGGAILFDPVVKSLCQFEIGGDGAFGKFKDDGRIVNVSRLEP